MRQKYLAILLILFSVSLQAQQVSVPLDYWGYRFLDRLETKGLYQSHDLRARPIGRMTFAKILAEIDSSKTAQNLSSAELGLLQQMKSDFSAELADLNIRVSAPEPHLYQWQEENSGFSFDLYGRESIISNRGAQFDPDELLSETSLGGMFRGNLGGAVGFYMDARNAITRGSDVEEESFDLSQGSPVVTSGPNVIRDRAVAYFVLEKPWARLEIGRNEIDWGPAYHGGLSVTRNMPPADMIRLVSRFRKFKFTSTHAFLSSSLGPKYLAAHRLDWQVKPGIYFGATESVVYGGRDVEFSYLNPLMPYHVAEHHLGDRDNNTLSIDLTLTRIPSLKLYGEFFIDDMTSTKSWTSYFGNKFGLMAGAYWVDPLGLPNVDLRAEFTRVEPYVYTHWDSINIYTHYDKVIGSWLGPNADDIYIEAAYQPVRDFRIELFFERKRKGEGTVSTISEPAEGEKKQFLHGTVEKSHMIGFRLIDQLRRDLFVSISYTYADGRNLGLVPGFNSSDHLARFELYFNY